MAREMMLSDTLPRSTYKVLAFQTPMRPTTMYTVPVWRCDISLTKWARYARLHMIMGSKMTESNPLVPHQIMQIEFTTTHL